MDKPEFTLDILKDNKMVNAGKILQTMAECLEDVRLLSRNSYPAGYVFSILHRDGYVAEVIRN